MECNYSKIQLYEQWQRFAFYKQEVQNNTKKESIKIYESDFQY